MKKISLVIVLALSSFGGFTQTATNFTCNDCLGASHNLFTELDAGKVIVLNWVMPCGACTGPSLTTYNVVNSYQATYPGRVFQYLTDDLANTSCASLTGWATSNGIAQNTWSLRFSNASINMLDYGSTGMPKIVVVGGSNHTVYYNVNNTVSTAALQNAINAALSSTGINEQNSLISSLNVYPNPSDKSSEIKFNLAKPANVKMELFNLEGKKMNDIFSGMMNSGENKVEINTSRIPAGMYLVKMTSDGSNRFMNILVSH